MPELLAACDLFVLPSLFEGVPLSILEAMASGKAVVATRVDGTAEVVDDDRTGLLVPPAHPAALSSALIALLTDEDRRLRMGKEGRERAAAEFDRRIMIGRHASPYEMLLHDFGRDGNAHHSLQPRMVVDGGRRKISPLDRGRFGSHRPASRAAAQ